MRVGMADSRRECSVESLRAPSCSIACARTHTQIHARTHRYGGEAVAVKLLKKQVRRLEAEAQRTAEDKEAEGHREEQRGTETLRNAERQRDAESAFPMAARHLGGVGGCQAPPLPASIRHVSHSHVTQGH
jgi:hypothetical protein